VKKRRKLSGEKIAGTWIDTSRGGNGDLFVRRQRLAWMGEKGKKKRETLSAKKGEKRGKESLSNRNETRLSKNREKKDLKRKKNRKTTAMAICPGGVGEKNKNGVSKEGYQKARGNQENSS